VDRIVTAERHRGFRELIEDRCGLLDADRYEPVVARIVRVMVEAFKGDRKVLWMGNGGSSVNSSAVTAIANDYGYEHVFARQAEAFTQPGDVVVGMTTSGNSQNIVLALEAAKRRGAITVAFSGNGGGKVAEIADITLIGPDGYSALVQEVHITLGHIICDLLEQALFV
jgi:D-sedoheptulose 7-phosphate isomerase